VPPSSEYCSVNAWLDEKRSNPRFRPLPLKKISEEVAHLVSYLKSGQVMKDMNRDEMLSRLDELDPQAAASITSPSHQSTTFRSLLSLSRRGLSTQEFNVEEVEGEDVIAFPPASGEEFCLASRQSPSAFQLSAMKRCVSLTGSMPLRGKLYFQIRISSHKAQTRIGFALPHFYGNTYMQTPELAGDNDHSWAFE
jgi:hypothetical protein